MDELSKKEGKTWVWQGADCIKGKVHRCMIQVSDGGTDARVVREFDLEIKSFVEGGFVLPQAKSYFSRHLARGRRKVVHDADHRALALNPMIPLLHCVLAHLTQDPERVAFEQKHCDGG